MPERKEWHLEAQEKAEAGSKKWLAYFKVVFLVVLMARRLPSQSLIHWALLN